MRNIGWAIDVQDIIALVVAFATAYLAIRMGEPVTGYGFGAIVAIFFVTLWLVEKLFNYLWRNRE